MIVYGSSITPMNDSGKQLCEVCGKLRFIRYEDEGICSPCKHYIDRENKKLNEEPNNLIIEEDGEEIIEERRKI